MAFHLSWVMVFLLVKGLAFYSTIVLSQDHPGPAGFISIDCGLSKDDNDTDYPLSFTYVSDDGYIETGNSTSIAPNLISGTQKQLRSLRYFPNGDKNCYTIRPIQGKSTDYLIRATFYYGNYDSKNMAPEFELYLGTDLWDNVKFNNPTDVVTKEIIYTPSADYFYVCVANIDKGIPFISLLEIRHLGSSIYGMGSCSLNLVGRYYTGPTTNGIIRYGDDVFDRIWEPQGLPSLTNISTDSDMNISSNEFMLPPLAMRAATTVMNKDDQLLIPLTFSMPPKEGQSTYRFVIYLHFAEVIKLSANENREFTVNINGEQMHDGPITPSYLKASTTNYNTTAIVDSGITISLMKTARSTLPPIVNALEYFMMKAILQALTNQDDVNAILEIKSAYGLSKKWQGDPCVPQKFLWNGVNCNFKNLNSPNIITLNLSSNGLTGNIASSFSDLTSLQILDLSNNSLTGKIPESLASLPSLRILNLSMNKLTGPIPQRLLDKQKTGQLTLRFDAETDPCSTSSCPKDKTPDQPSTPTHPKMKNLIIVLVLATVGALIGLVIVLGILFLIKKRKIAVTTTEQTRQLTYNRKDRGIARYSYAEVIDMTKGFEKELGKGGFGMVYYGCLKDGTQVAVKKLYFTAHGLEQFETEIDLLMTICHKNLVCLLGYCDEGENLVLIYEYMVNGDLQRAISANDAQTWKQRLKIAIDAAQGLDHLHQECRPPIVHRDVKTSNILLNENLEAKVSDFGISKIFPDEYLTHVTTKIMGTCGYLDPDYFVTLQLKDKSDVYSFGVVLLELMTGQHAIVGNKSDMMSLVDVVKPLVETGDIWSIVDQRVKDSIQNQNSVSRFVDVAMSCLKRRAKKRPSMSQVVIDLKECLAMEMGNNKRYSKSSQSMEMIFTVTSSGKDNNVTKEEHLS